LLAAAIGAGLILRFWGLGFGLPYRYHPDEAQYVADAARMLNERTLQPSAFNNPPLFKYVIALGDALWSAGQLLGTRTGLQQLIDRVTLDPSPLYFVGRIVSALAGSATVLVTYLLGRASHNTKTGLLSAGILAATFLHVRESHYAVNDATLTLLTTLSLLGSIRVARRDDRYSGWLAAAAAGLAFATKYTGALALIPLTLAHLVSPTSQTAGLVGPRVRRLTGSWLMVAAAAVIGSPLFLLKPGAIVNEVLGGLVRYGRSGFEGWQIDAAGGYLYYLKALGWGVGIGIIVMLIVGVFANRDKVGMLLLSYPLAFFVFMGNQQMYFARLLLPTLPAIVVLAASGLDQSAARLSHTAAARRLMGETGELLIGAVLLVAMLAQPLSSSIRHNVLLTRIDTRTVAKQWIEENIPVGAKIAVDWPYHGPPLSTLDDPQPNSDRTYDVLVVGGHGLSDHSLDYYQAHGVQYLIESGSISYLEVTDSLESETRHAFYDSLGEVLSQRFVVEPGPMPQPGSLVFDELYGPAVALWSRSRPGPTIRIFEFPAVPSVEADMP